MSYGKSFGVTLGQSFAPPATSSVTAGAGHAAAAVGHGLVAAAPFLAGIAAAAGAVFLTRAALQGLAGVATTERVIADQIVQDRTRSIAWERSFAEVMERNVRIERLRRTFDALSGAQAGVFVELPEPFSYQGEELTALGLWCTTTDGELEKAEQAVAQLRVQVALADPDLREATARRRARAGLTTGLSGLEHYLLAEDQEVGPHPGQPSGPPPRRRSTAVPKTVAALVGALTGTVAPDDLVRCVRQANVVLATENRDNQYFQLQILEQLARKAHEDQTRRTNDAEVASKLLLGLAPLDRPFAPAEVQQVFRELRAVAAEQQELTPMLQAAAHDLADEALRTVQDTAILANIVDAFVALEYDVAEDAAAGLAISLKRKDQAGARAVLTVERGRVEANFQADPLGHGRQDLQRDDWQVAVEQVFDRLEKRDLLVSGLLFDGVAVTRGDQQVDAAPRTVVRRPEMDQDVELERDHGSDE